MKNISIGCSEYPETIWSKNFEIGKEKECIFECDFFAERKFFVSKITEKQMTSMKKEVRQKLNVTGKDFPILEMDIHIHQKYEYFEKHITKYVGEINYIRSNMSSNECNINYTIKYPMNWIHLSFKI